MKTSCAIIKDILPLYIDEVCSDESKQLVEEHIARCPTCSSELALMKAAVSVDRAQNIEDARVVKDISQEWKTRRLRSFLKGAGIAAVIIVGVTAVIFLIADVRLVMN